MSVLYRASLVRTDLESTRIKLKETDVLILAEKAQELKRLAEDFLLFIRRDIENYLSEHPEFLFSLSPVAVEADAPSVIRKMADAAFKAGVGPMAAVAGAIAEELAEFLSKFRPEVIVENGGDIHMQSQRERVVAIYAGSSPLSGKIGVRLSPGIWGVATSSAKVGHSLSFGSADAVTVISGSGALSDAFATALGNRVRSEKDIEPALSWLSERGGPLGVKGAVVILGKHAGFWGEIEVVRL